MADIGVLNLTIHDNSEQAAGGLHKLADALFRVKRAVNSATNLKGISTQLDKIAKVVNDSISGSTIEKLAQFGDALARLKGLGNININIRNKDGLSGAVESIQAGVKGMEGIREEFEEVKGKIENVGEAYENFGERMRRTNDLVQNMKFGGWYDQFQEMLEGFMQMRSSMALGPGSPMTSEIENGLIVWKDGAIEVEGTVSDATEAVNEHLEATQQSLKSVVDETERAQEAVENFVDSSNRVRSEAMVFDPDTGDFTKPLSQALEELKQRQEETRKSHQGMMKAFEAAKSGVMGEVEQNWARSLEKVTAEAKSATMQVEELVKWLNRSRDGNWSQGIDRMLNIEGPVKSAKESMDVFVQSMGDVSDAAQEVQKLNPELAEYANEAKKASRESKNFSERLKELKEAAENTHFGKLLSAFGRILKYRVLRSVLKHISEGFSEGVQNVYEYSKAMGTSLAPAMDSAASAIQLMKNSIGAAVAPAIQALIPLLQTVVNFFVRIINYVNQFFALIRGQQTWTRAIPASTTAFAKQEKAAKSAKNALNELLASWDELNVIQSTSDGGGGAGGTGADNYLGMFEEVSTFNGEVTHFADRIKETFGDVWGLAKEIGAAILGWKASTAFSSLLGILGALVATGVTIDLVFRAVTTLDNTYYDTKKPGYLVADLLTTLIGGTLMNRVLGNVLGGKLASLAIPMTFAVSALASIKTLLGRADVSALSEEGVIGAVNAALKGGVAAGTGAYSLAKMGIGPALGAGSAIGIGVAAAAWTFGITIGLKAIADTLQTGEFSAKVLEADFISAGFVGTGIGIAEAVLGGTVGTIVAASGAGALITLGLLVGIEAIISGQPKAIRWGDKRLTQQQIENFVNNDIFTIKYKSNFEVYSEKVALAEGQDEEINKKVAALIPEVEALKVGIDTDTSISNIKNEIFETGGLIDAVNEKIANETAIVKAAITLVPVKDSEGNDLSADVIKQTSEGWGFLKGIMDDLGQSLSEQLAISEKEGIEASAKEMAAHNIAVLTQTMMEVSSALAAGRYMTEMSRDFQEGLTAAMDEGSVKGILDYYEKRKDEVQKGVEAAYQSLFDDVQSQIYTNQILLEEAMKNGGEYAGRTAQEYQDQITNLNGIYQMLLDNQESSIAQAMAFYESGDGKEKIRQAILSMLNVDLKQSDVTTAFGGGMDQIMTYIEDSLFSPEGQRYDGAKENLEAVIDNILKSVFGDDYETVKRLVDNNFLSLQDIFGDTLFTELEKVLNVDKKTTEIQEAWTKLRDEIMNPSGDNTVTPPDMTDFDNEIADSTRGLKEWNYWRDKMMSSGSGNYRASVPNLYSYGPRMFATGGFPDSGSLFMADENGNIEMKGKMGSQPVVANNQQIVSGISQGVSSANESVVSELRTVVTMLQKMLNKEFVARATPGPDWGRHNARSNAAYDRVTGV